MKVFKERDFVYKLIYLGAFLIFIFFIPVTPIPAVMRQNILLSILVLALFAVELFYQFKLGLTKYVINENKELIIMFMGKTKFSVGINKILSLTIHNEVSWIRRPRLFKGPRSKIYLVDGRDIPIYSELRDEDYQSLLEVLKSEYKIAEK